MENIENNKVTPEVNSEAQAPKEVKTEAKVEVPKNEALSTVMASDDLAIVTPKATTVDKPKAPVAATATAPAAGPRPAVSTEPRKPFNPRKPGDRPFGPRPDGERRPFTPRADGERRPFTPRDPNAPRTFTPRDPNAPRTFTPRDGSSRPAFGNRPGFGTSNSKFGGKPKFGQRRDGKKPFDNKEQDMFAEVITVRRVTRVVKGGKRMRFAALVVVGDKKGLVGFANRKGMDYQDAVAKATKKAKENMVKIKMNDDFSLPFTTVTKFKSAQILLKPATKGTSLLAGGYIRPVLELVGIKNIYSKIQGSNNKVVGVEAVINALKKYS